MSDTPWDIIAAAATKESPSSKTSFDALLKLNMSTADVLLVCSISTLALNAVNILSANRPTPPYSKTPTTFLKNLKQWGDAFALDATLASCPSSGGTLIGYLLGPPSANTKPLKKVFDTIARMLPANSPLSPKNEMFLENFELYMQGIVSMSESLITFLSDINSYLPVSPRRVNTIKGVYGPMIDQLTTFIC